MGEFERGRVIEPSPDRWWSLLSAIMKPRQRVIFFRSQFSWLLFAGSRLPRAATPEAPLSCIPFSARGRQKAAGQCDDALRVILRLTLGRARFFRARGSSSAAIPERVTHEFPGRAKLLRNTHLFCTVLSCPVM